MPISITRYLPEHVPEVRQLNQRIRGAGVRFPECHHPRWLPPAKGLGLFQEYFVATDEHGSVRGGYILKHQEFLLHGRKISLGDWQLPLSEGIVNPQYATVALQLYRHAIEQQPYLLGLGGGSLDEPILKVCRLLKWQSVPVPFFFRVVNAGRFLKQIGPLRRSRCRSAAASVLAISGLGQLTIHAIQLLRRYHRRPRGVSYAYVDSFAEWANEVWDQCGDRYGLIAVRDREVLNRLYPSTRVNPGRGHAGEPGQFERLRITRNGRTIGWAVVLASSMRDHRHFGDLRVGTIVDVLAAPQDACDSIACARDALCEHGVDLMVSNQSHAAWCQAHRSCGFLEGPTNFFFSAAPRLLAELQPFQENLGSFHLNRGDGDGPINL